MSSKANRALIAVTVTLLVIAFLAIQPTLAQTKITVMNNDDPDEGFNDQTDVMPVGGNPAVKLGQARLNALQFAADIWASRLISGVKIKIDAQFNSLDCGIFGRASPIEPWQRDFQNAPLASTWYPVALANAIAELDLDPGQADIAAEFNSNLDNNSCRNTFRWYYGLDANPPAGAKDFVTAALHELAHGLGFVTIVNVAGAKREGLNDVFILNLEHHGAKTSCYAFMSDKQRLAANRSDPNLHWIGPNVLTKAINLQAGFPNGHVQMHAPAKLAIGSSVIHFSQALFPDQPMEPSFEQGTHGLGLAVPLMQDIGWQGPASGRYPNLCR